MMQFNSMNGVAFGWHLHIVFGAVLFLGAVFLVIWAVKSFNKEQLRNWTIALLLIGLLGTLLTGSWGFQGWNQMMKWHNGYGDKDFKMMDFDDDFQEEFIEKMEENLEANE